MVKSGHLKKASTLSFVKMKIFMNDFGLKAIRHRWYYKKTKKYLSDCIPRIFGTQSCNYQAQ